MLIPGEGTKCVEAVRETIEPGIVTPPNPHAQIYFIVSGKARVWIGDETKDTLGPAAGFVPQNTNHYVNHIGDVPSTASTSAFGRSQLRNRMAANGANRRAPW
jgi:mannose-6-phosphate isomerase-like protein (cupin superfamily)